MTILYEPEISIAGQYEPEIATAGHYEITNLKTGHHYGVIMDRIKMAYISSNK
jgi:hypothetical protein